MTSYSFDDKVKTLPFLKADELIIREFHQQFPAKSKKSIISHRRLPFLKADELIIRTFHKAHEREF